MVRVITLTKDYAPGCATGFSQFCSGDPKHAIALSPRCDGHFIPTKQYGLKHPLTGAAVADVDYQAVAEGPLAEGHAMDGLVLSSSLQLVPVATVQFEFC